MIHDATGKFSSRWVFPDRSSLALVIRNWLHSSGLAACADAQRTRGDRVPHIGEYAAKTNAIWACQPRHAPAIKPKMGCPRRLTGANAAYCPLFLRTWSQAVLILERCSFRHARMVKSPWSITGRQNFCTSRVQAFCSSAVPLRCCWAKASDETGSTTGRVRGEIYASYSFISASKKSCSRFALRHRRDGFVWMACAA